MTWTSPPLAVFKALSATIEERFGPPCARDLDSNGIGLFDCLCLRFGCGLEVALWRFHLGAQLRRIDSATEPSAFEIHASEMDLAHVSFHLDVPIASMALWTDADDVPLAPPLPPSFSVMRADDNGNEFEITRVTSRCEADALVRRFEARGHKQSYWVRGPQS